MFGSSSQLLTTGKRTVIKSASTVNGNETVLGSSRKLGGAAKHLIGGSERRIRQLSFEFWSPRVIERRSKRIKL